MTICVCCENDFDVSELHNIDGDYYCDDCINDNFSTCECCGSLVNNDDLGEVNGEIICEDCLSRHYVYCERCGDYEHIDRAMYVNGYYYCEYCIDNYFTYCECCDSYVSNDDYNFDDDCCYECSSGRIIQSYHNQHGNWTKYGTVEFIGGYGIYKGFGVELEIDSKEYKDDGDKTYLAEKLQNIAGDRIYFENDGSLDYGFEIITHPHTETEFYKIDWKTILNTIRENDFTSHDNGNCSLHIHFSKTWLGFKPWQIHHNTAKLLKLYETYFDDFLRGSRRTYEQFEHWAKRYNETRPKQCYELACDEYGTRYYAINLQNSKTVEFRLGRGTLNYNSFMAWIDLHFTIVKNIQSIKWQDVNNLDKWLQGVKPATMEYLHSKGAFMQYNVKNEGEV